MLITNLITGSTPSVLHRNGNPPQWHAQWEKIVAAFFAEAHEPCEPCPELTIITWSNRPTKSLLERCLDARGVSYLTLGKGLPEWRNDMKVYLNATTLERISSEYVMGLDSDDVLVVACPRRIVADFRAHGCDILFSTERNSCPDVPSLTEFERALGTSRFRHLNSGAWIGRTDACRRYFRDCLEEDNGDILAVLATRSNFRDDQCLTRKTFQRYYPAARLDDECRIFQSLFNVPIEGEVLVASPTLRADG
jgi:hypothetical protein